MPVRRQEQLLQVDITHGLLAEHWKANRRPPVNGYRQARRDEWNQNMYRTILTTLALGLVLIGLTARTASPS